MNLLIKVVLVCLCLSTINSLPFQKSQPNLDELRRIFESDEKVSNGLEVRTEQEQPREDTRITNVLRETTTLRPNQTRNETELTRSKRQLGAPLGFRSYDYGDYYGGLTGDYNYDYYDWVCSETRCQLCNILGGECCDPDANPNCFLPDTCLNNPCLAGGSCVTTQTIDGRPDFLCICLPGLTGKYCQITNDYIVDGFLPRVPIGPAFPPHGPFPSIGGTVNGGVFGGPVAGGAILTGGPVPGPVAGASNGQYGYQSYQPAPAPAPAVAPAPAYQSYQPAPAPEVAPAPAPAPSYQPYSQIMG